MEIFLVAILWGTSFLLTGLTLSTARRVEKKVEDIAKRLEQQELYEHMRNQQYNNSNYNNQL